MRNKLLMAAAAALMLTGCQYFHTDGAGGYAARIPAGDGVEVPVQARFASDGSLLYLRAVIPDGYSLPDDLRVSIGPDEAGQNSIIVYRVPEE